LPRM